MDFQKFKAKYEHKKVQEYHHEVDEKPLVSVCVQTYQHAPYIKECLDSILMQKTNFEFEIIVGEDNSSDGTREICMEYAKKYPNKIRLLLHHRENNIRINDTPSGRFNFLYNLCSARGKYIALCEGDDFWLDETKLQKQVEYLEKNTDCTISFHRTKFYNKNCPDQNLTQGPNKIPKDSKFQMKDAILGGGNFMATNSMVLLRQNIKSWAAWMTEAPVGDIPLMLASASRGRIGYINEIMAAYRVSTAESWSRSMDSKNRRVLHHHAMLEMWSEFDKWTNYNFHKYVQQKKRKNIWTYHKANIRKKLEKIFMNER